MQAINKFCPNLQDCLIHMNSTNPIPPCPAPKYLLLYFWWWQRASCWSPLLLRSIEILLLGLIGHGTNSAMSTLHSKTQNQFNEYLSMFIQCLPTAPSNPTVTLE